MAKTLKATKANNAEPVAMVPEVGELPVGDIVDQYGEICAMLSFYEREKAALRAVLESSVLQSAEGKLFRITVSTSERTSVDLAALRRVVHASIIDCCTKKSIVTTVRCAARTGKD